VITAVGDRTRMQRALADSAYLDIYRDYVAAYGLGYQEESRGEVTLPAYDGPSEVKHATVVG
ncbi:MAG: DUF881 domain-containing protein, partial [Propioniciclava sp.]